ncbi:MAG TPA: rRNA maturation RNase YbeY [Chitinophagaceae bacterium]|nr:rRNA maturation RNase YbeY [Chitinophagaceae bacterium]
MSPSLSLRINFFFEGPGPALKNRRKLKAFISSLFEREGARLESLNLIFTDDKRILEINRKYLNHDFYTDIITFNLANGGQPVIGEVYISRDRVKANARLQSTSMREELHRVIFHGILHLCGYNDKSGPETREMRIKENAYLAEYFQ